MFTYRPARNPFLPYIVFIGIALLGVMTLNYALPDGVDLVSNDSITYLKSAANIKAGRGFVFGIPGSVPSPVVHFPPLYPLSLAAFGIFSEDIRHAGKLLNLTLYGVNILLTCIVAYFACESISLGALSGLLLLTSSAIFEVHVGALSEPLFLTLGALGVWAFVLGDKKRSEVTIMASALLFGLSATARYSGVVWIATGILSLWILTDGEVMPKIWRAFRYGCLAMLPLAVVLVRHQTVASSGAHRKIAYHLISKEHIVDGLATVAAWFLPWRFVSWSSGILIVFLFLVGFGVGVLPLCRRKISISDESGRAQLSLSVILMLFMLIYAAHLVLSISLVDFSTPLDDRILCPIFAIFVIWFSVVAGAFCYDFMVPVSMRGVFGAGCAALILFGGIRVTADCFLIHRTGRGFITESWMKDPVMLELGKMPANAVIFSNDPGAIIGRLDRGARMVPLKEDPYTSVANADAAVEFEMMRKALKEQSGVLAYVYRRGDKAPGVRVSQENHQEFSEVELTRMLPLSLLKRTEHFALYRLAE